jgi:hypothetical protein
LHDLARDVADIRALGITHLSVAASYHAGKFIHPHDPVRRVVFPEDGTIYFRPRGAYGRIKPVVSVLTRERDVLAELTDARQIGLNAWVVLNHNSRLGMLYPDLAVRNCFNDAYPYSLCPTQPDVREYAIALCADLAQHYAVETLLLETPGFLGYAHGFHHEFAQVVLDDWLDGMFALCFCECCVAGATAAGIDAEALRRRVAERIDAALASGACDAAQAAEERLLAERREDADLDAFHTWRAQTVTALVAGIRAVVRKDVRVKVISTTLSSHTRSFIEGGDLTALDGVSDGLEAPIYQPSLELAHGQLDHLAKRLPPVRTSVILRPGLPDMRDEAQFKSIYARVHESGIRDIAFYNYGMLPRANLDWIRRQLIEG